MRIKKGSFLRREHWFLLGFFVLTVFFGLGNLPSLVGDFSDGIVKDGILDSNNRIVQSDQFVRQFSKEGFLPLEVSMFVLPIEKSQINPKSILTLNKIHQEIQAEFPRCKVVSLVNLTNPRVEEDEFYTTAYLDEEVIEEVKTGNWDKDKWLADLKSKAGPKGILYAEDQSFFRILLILPLDYNENEFRNRVAMLLEKRFIPWYFWFLKSDISPTGIFANVKLAGWVIGRGLMTAALTSNIVRLAGLGFLLVWFFSYKTFQSKVKASIILVTIAASFIWLRGTAGWLHWISLNWGYPMFWGLPIKERVFILLVFTFLIIGGISAKSRVFEKFNDYLGKEGSVKELFRLTIRALRGKFLIIALIGLLNFISLYQIGTRGIMEVGMLCFIGLLYVFFLAVKVLPNLYLVFSRFEKTEEEKSNDRVNLFYLSLKAQAAKVYLGWLVELFAVFLIKEKWNRLLNSIVATSYSLVSGRGYSRYLRWLTPFDWKKSLFGVVLPLFGAFLGIILMQYLGAINPQKYGSWARIRFDENPTGYFASDSNFRQGTDIVNELGSGTAPGRASFLVLPRESGVTLDEASPDYWKKLPSQVKKLSAEESEGYRTIDDPQFIRRVWQLQEKMREIAGVRQVWSSIDILSDYSSAVYGKPLPSTKREVYNCFSRLEEDLDEQENGQMLAQMSWFDRGISVSAFVPAESANQILNLQEETAAIVRDHFPDLIVAPYGQFHLYAQTAQVTVAGKIINMATSFWVVIPVIFIWIKLSNLPSRRRREILFRLSAWRTSLVVTVPFVFAFSVNAIVFWIFGIAMDQALSCATAFSINAAIDFNIYFVDDYKNALLRGKNLDQALEIALLEKGRPVIVDCLLNAICFAPLASSSFKPVRALGVVLFFMMFLCGLGTLVLMPAIMPICTKAMKS